MASTGDNVRLKLKEKKPQMKKLMTLMLGLALVTGTVAVSFAGTADTASSTKKKKSKKKGGDTTGHTRTTASN